MKCVNCSNNSFYECDSIQSAGGYGPDLLPGTGIIYHGKFSIKICSECKHVHWFVKDSDMKRIKESSRFTFKEYNE